MGRSACCEKVGLKKGQWTPEEDKKLVAYVEEHGHGNWRSVAAKAGLQRCGKSCRLRWINYLKPDIKRGNFSLEEDCTIMQLHALLGNKWSIIAAHLPKRTDNEIKNYWSTNIKKRLIRMGLDPTTHKPIKFNYGGHNQQYKDAINISHVAQWECVRLEAEARGSMYQVGSSSSHLPQLMITKIPTQPSSNSSSSSSSKHNNNAEYNMYALMLSTDHDLPSPVSTLGPGNNSNVVGQFTQNSLLYNKGNIRNVIETSGASNIFQTRRIMEGYVSNSNSHHDDDFMTAMEAFREENVLGGLINDCFDGNF
ncbi:hypothetical protein RJT34_11588 [Clitoria ternatea]|uniref:Uncharacterized protein n=1 Tax=Clitoria ternatea TaxID=43366 RepID=A0AAN9PK71_CLITE